MAQVNWITFFSRAVENLWGTRQQGSEKLIFGLSPLGKTRFAPLPIKNYESLCHNEPRTI